MAKQSNLPAWPQYPKIPTYLDPQDAYRLPKNSEAAEKGYSAPAISSAERSPQRRVVEHSQYVPKPYVKEPRPGLLKHQGSQQRRRPPLQFFLDNKLPRERYSKIQSHKLARRQFLEGYPTPLRTTEASLDDGKKSSHGLGISDVPPSFKPSPIASPVTEKDDPNLAQRLEKRLWRYNTSGNVLKRWLLEIISWILSAICMGAIIGVLIFLKDEKLPKWPLGLTLNAYIAVLSKISSAALLLPTSEALGQLKWSWFQRDSKKMWDFEIFDNASRGPWGAILLLIRTKGRSLAALGAIITLFSLALDPFFQQVVDFPERWMCTGWNSTIPKVIRYEPVAEQVFQNGQRRVIDDMDIEVVANKFFFGNGTQPVPFGNGTRVEIPLSCPTSNCTWPAYESLGVCSSCADIQEMLEFRCINTKVDWIQNLTGSTNDSTYPSGMTCGYYLNATSPTPILMSGYLVESVESIAGKAPAGEALLGRTLPLVTNPGRQSLFGGSVNFKHIRNPIVDIFIVGTADATSVYQNQTPVAQECVLSWCVKTIRSSWYWASYEEEEIARFLNTSAGPDPFLITPVKTSGGLNANLTSYTENVTINMPLSRGETLQYGLSNQTAFSVIALFDDIFPSWTTTKNASATPLLRYVISLSATIMRPVEFNPWLPPNNVTSHMERLATALTNSVRSSTSKKMIPGMAFERENYVAVRWLWLTLPLSLLVLTFIFLVATVMKASRESERVGVWKTSAIATLLYGLPDDMQKKITSSTSTGTPRTKAKELRVRMLSKGWRASGNVFSPLTPKVRQNRPPPGWI